MSPFPVGKWGLTTLAYRAFWNWGLRLEQRLLPSVAYLGRFPLPAKPMCARLPSPPEKDHHALQEGAK